MGKNVAMSSVITMVDRCGPKLRVSQLSSSYQAMAAAAYAGSLEESDEDKVKRKK